MPLTDGEWDAIVPQLRAGDRDALARFFAGQRERLWKMAHFRIDPRLRRRVDVDDVLQQVFLDASQRLGHFEGESALSAFVWLRLVAAQTIVDLHRMHLGAHCRAADREIFLDQGPGGDATSCSMAHHLAASWTSPSGELQREEAAGRLQDALAGMDPIDREVLALRHFEELGNNEVAEILGIQPKAASIRYTRALGRLRTVLETLGGFEPGKP
jgi:RNA polymerase sigma-70 factor (ECF subfamily)